MSVYEMLGKTVIHFPQITPLHLPSFEPRTDLSVVHFEFHTSSTRETIVLLATRIDTHCGVPSYCGMSPRKKHDVPSSPTKMMYSCCDMHCVLAMLLRAMRRMVFFTTGRLTTLRTSQNGI